LGEYIQISAATGGSFSAYISLPSGGRGPGLVLCQEIFGVNDSMKTTADSWAEEGYVVIVPDLFWRISPNIQLGYSEQDWQKAFELFQAFDIELGVQDLAASVEHLRTLSSVDGKVGAVGFCLGGTLAYLCAAGSFVDCAVGYYGVGIDKHLDKAASIKVPLALHFAELDAYCDAPARELITATLAANKNVVSYLYPGVDHAFARPLGAHYHKQSSNLAHQRSLTTIKSAIGPNFDLSALWDKHCEYEFESRDVDATMATMVSEPYVNHIPTMTGGVGFKNLYRFYKHHFVDGNPPDTKITPVSRTVGTNQVVDEILFSFTHTTEVEWLAPGIAPTGRYIEFPVLAVIRFRGDKLCHEHIYWDQASVLVQMGLIDQKTLPVTGIEASRKLVDESLPSNTLMHGWSKSENK
jgi:carboxymethylenebutenolidase